MRTAKVFTIGLVLLLLLAIGIGLNFGAAVLGVELAWFDRTGKEVAARLPRDSYRDPTISPDGRRLAFTELDLDTGFRSIFELIVETGERRRLTSGLSNIGDRFPAFSPDGETLGCTPQPCGDAHVPLPGQDRSCRIGTPAS